jgi:hypothetical protein
MADAKIKYQPSIYVRREAGESVREFMERVLADSRLLPDQRTSLELERYSVFDDFVQGVWMEQPPLVIDAALSAQPSHPPIPVRGEPMACPCGKCP